MMAEGLDVAQALGRRPDGAHQRLARPLVQLGPPGEEEVLVDDGVESSWRNRYRGPSGRSPAWRTRSASTSRSRPASRLPRSVAKHAGARGRTTRRGRRPPGGRGGPRRAACRRARATAPAGSRGRRAGRSAGQVQPSPARTSTPLPIRLRAISSTNSGLPPARATISSSTAREARRPASRRGP